MPNLFRDLDADALEREYLPNHWPNLSTPETIERWTAKSAAFHERVACKADIKYGDSDRECLDLFCPDTKNAPILVFIHGGYWRGPRLTKKSNSFCIEPIVNAGAMVAMIEYDLCPNVTMDTIVAQVQSACAWLFKNADDYGGNTSRLHIAGHSAGGHLSAMMTTTNWEAYEDGLPNDMIKSIIPISGLFELEPLRLCSLNADLRLDVQSASRNSPANLKPNRKLPISVVVGGAESDEFRRQSLDFANSWRSLTSEMEFVEVPEQNHFDVVEAMPDPDNPLTAIILQHLELG